MSDDPILSALATAAQAPASAPPGPVSAPSADPISAALHQRATSSAPTPAPGAPLPTFSDFLTHPLQSIGRLSASGQLSVSDAASAAWHHLEKIPVGVAQLAANGLNAPVRALDSVRAPVRAFFGLGPDTDPVGTTVTKGVDAFNRGISNWEANYQASTPNSPSAYLGATAGEIAPFLLDAPVRGLSALGDYVGSKAGSWLPAGASKVAPAVSKVTSGAVQGATVGGVQPVTSPAPTITDLVTGSGSPGAPSYWDDKFADIGSGAAFGGALAGATGAMGAAYRGAADAVRNSPILNPQNYAAGQVSTQLGADAPSIATKLQSAPTYVPGSVPTSAQAAADPRLVMMEKALANESPKFQVKLQNLGISNNAARWGVINDVAKTPTDLQAAIDKREAVTGPMRDFTVTNGNPVPVQGVTDALSSLTDGSLGVRPTIGGAANTMRSTIDGFTTVTPPDTLMNVPGSATAHPSMLDAMRQNTNDYLAKYAPNGIVGTQEQVAMAPVKTAIIDAINGANPGRKMGTGGWGQGLVQFGPPAPSYRDYLTEFAKQSVPINTMEVGQGLADSLGAKATDASGTPLITLPAYTSKLAQALRNSPYAIDPLAQAALDGVQADLQRSSISNSVRAPGSDTAYNQGAGSAFLDALGAHSDPGLGKMAAAGAAGLLATGSPQGAAAAAFGAKKLGAFASKRVSGALGDLLVNPQALAEALNAQSKSAGNAAPTVIPRIPTRAAALALALQRQAAQAPQVVQPNAKQPEAYQP